MAYGFTYTLPTITGSHSNMPIGLKTADFPATSIDASTNSFATGGGDMMAYTSSDKTTQLPLEIVTFVSSATVPDAEVWVKIDTAATGGTIYLEADDTQTVQPAVGTTYGRNAVWTDYEVVYHLGEDPSGSAPQMLDSTGNGMDLTTAGTMTSGDSIASVIGNGADFDGVDDFMSSPSTALDNIGTGDFTLTHWFNSGADSLEVLTSFNGNWIAINGANTMNTSATPILGTNTTSTGFNSSTDTFLSVSRSGTTVDLLINGAADSSGTNSTSHTGQLGLGGLASASFPAIVVLDEYRIASLALSDNWIATEYSNQSASTAWGAVGPWALASGAAAITSVGGDDVVLDAETPAFVTTGFSSEISTVQLVSGTSTTNGSSVSSTSGTGTFVLPDITGYVVDTVGCPLTTANNIVVARLTDA